MVNIQLISVVNWCRLAILMLIQIWIRILILPKFHTCWKIRIIFSHKLRYSCSIASLHCFIFFVSVIGFTIRGGQRYFFFGVRYTLFRLFYSQCASASHSGLSATAIRNYGYRFRPDPQHCNRLEPNW